MAASTLELQTAGIRGRVVFHADDLGMSAAVNDGIIEAFERGLLTSTSVLANGPAASQALAAIKKLIDRAARGELPSAARRRALGDKSTALDLGVHLNLTQGRPLTGQRYPYELLDARGCFLGPGRLFVALMRFGRRFTSAIRAELVEQIGFVLDHGMTPTHVNGHQYVEMFPYVSEAVVGTVRGSSIPVMRLACEKQLAATTLGTRGVSSWAMAHVKRRFGRRLRPRLDREGLRYADEYFGAAHAGHITLKALACRLPFVADSALLEVGIHPGETSAETMSPEWRDSLTALRPRERDLLCCNELVELMHAQRLGLGRLSALVAKRAVA